MAMAINQRTAFLIETVKNYPMLYDSSHEEFKNMKLKNRIWSDIAMMVGDNNGDAIKARWRNLRDCYGKHLRSRSTTGPTSKHIARYKTWPWVQQMKFLKPFVLETQHGIDNEKNTDSQRDPPDQTHKSKSLKRGQRDEGEADFQVDKVISFLNNTSSSDYDAVDLIFLGYSRTVKKFSPHKQALAKYKIAKVVMEMELEHIQEMTQTAVEFVNPEDRCETPRYIDPPEVKLETLEDDLPNFNT